MDEVSLWRDTVSAPDFPTLEGDTECEALVIGGGMAGILTARFLSERGIHTVVAEARQIGGGATGNTTAVITAQHDLLYGRLRKARGTEAARQYLNANLFAVGEFRRRAADCDFEDVPSFMYSVTDWKTPESEAEFLCRLGYPAKFITELPLPFKIAGAVKFGGMAQFHPLKFLYAQSAGLNIYEHTFVDKVKNNTAYTREGFRIKARHIVVATHFPFINGKGLYFVKMCQNRSYVLALGAGQDADIGGTYTEYEGDGLYFRHYKGLLLAGGADRRVGKPGGGYERVGEFAAKYYPNAPRIYAWSAQDGMTLDAVPYIGRYASARDNLYVAAGFNEWGMTSSMIAARVIADSITGEHNDFAEVFAPNRGMLTPQLFKNLGTTLANFVKPTVKRCPHLGCALKFNKKERTWECPCHGSRFTEQGK
ncbi:MAG: FAD-dependent oxidoreductase, partial [Firmicutes bacterium]|nr:FAD-dependent oxidoreductase [Bacillota bacterium]